MCIRYKNKCREFQEEINEYLQRSKTPNDEENYNKLMSVLGKIKEITTEVFERYEKSQKQWGEDHFHEETCDEFSDVLYQIEFLSYMISKLACDNNWLVDWLEDMGQENHRLREDGKMSPSKIREDTINELKAASTALRGFEEARSKLLSQFSDASREGGLKY